MSPRLSIHRLALTLVLVLVSSHAELSRAEKPAEIEFEKRQLTDKYYCDGIAAGDINKDGHADVIAGPFWYAGPDFSRGRAFYKPVPLEPEKSPSNSMFSLVHDINGDGWLDILVLGRVHVHEAFWYENPAPPEGELWQKHFVAKRVKGESPTLLDIDGDGRVELITHDESQWGLLSPQENQPTEPWEFTSITEKGKYNQWYHGTGVGDLNGDGRWDLILNDGWWEQPANRSRALWREHKVRFAKGRGGAQMFADDLNGDGKADVITSLDAHGWGLAWFEQQSPTEFREHKIMGDRSEIGKYKVAFTQPHALAYADIDGDGRKDIVTGKRRWAHGPKGDIEPGADPVIYWFRQVREEGQPTRFEPNMIDANSGVGVQIAVRDLNGDDQPDILSASKLGTFLFLQRQRKP